MIHIQKRLSKRGNVTVYRVHRIGDKGYFWTSDYSRAGAFARSIWHEGDRYTDCGR